MLLAAGHSWRPDHGLGQWTGAAVAIVALHAFALGASLITWQSVIPPTPPPAAIMIELAPLPVSPPAPVTQAAQETPPVEKAPELELPLPEIDTVPPVIPQPEITLPIPEIDMVPPTIPEPEVVLPKPVPEKPKEQVAEKPKEKPKEKPPEKPPEKPGQKPKPADKPKPEAEPTVAQKAPPQPSQQVAAAAAPLQQAAAPAAPSAADIARRANAEANWQGILLAHLEKHKKYPKSARKRHEQGTSFLRFRMDRNGTVLSFALARSSGYAALDEEVLAMIARAQPLPALPAEITDPVVEIVVPVQFTLR
ncbi:MAG TPA: TonB family protein [Dongiaceae bacterium]|nr:TonB family protein [Dongiaceae bacterium]